jgi:NUMOD4 motif
MRKKRDAGGFTARALDINLLGLEWRTVPEFGRYEVSSLGHVRRGKLLKRTKHKGGHLSVTVYSDNGVQWPVGVHRLVALAFIGPPPRGKPLACLKNGRPGENVATNLSWVITLRTRPQEPSALHQIRTKKTFLTVGKIRYRNRIKMLERIARQWGTTLVRGRS